MNALFVISRVPSLYVYGGVSNFTITLKLAQKSAICTFLIRQYKYPPIYLYNLFTHNCQSNFFHPQHHLLCNGMQCVDGYRQMYLLHSCYLYIGLIRLFPTLCGLSALKVKMLAFGWGVVEGQN